jgi:hypothetical protein
MSASRPAAFRRGPSAKPRSKVLARRIAAGGAEQGAQAGLHLAGADALQALGDEDAVVAVELHHVGHGAERDQVEQAARFGFLAAGGEGAALRAVRRAAPA